MAANFLMRLPPVPGSSPRSSSSLCSVLAVSPTCFSFVSGAGEEAAPRNASAKLCSVSFCHLQLPVAAAAKVFKLCAHLQRLVANVRVAAVVLGVASAAPAAAGVAVALAGDGVGNGLWPKVLHAACCQPDGQNGCATVAETSCANASGATICRPCCK